MSNGAAFEDQQSAAPLLNDQWQRQQKKTFTGWVNSHLRKRSLQVDEITKDLSDGKLFIHLLEIISDEQLPKPSRGKMRIHHIENVGTCMKYIQSKGVDVSSIAPEEVVDGNLKMILGLVWMLILRFEIQDISEDQLNAKDALLLWCQRKTKPYDNVEVQNFHMSWKDGLAFCALIHRHCPHLINYDELTKGNPRKNLETAFSVADKEFNIPPLLDVEDMLECVKPDERSVITYVVTYYKYFASFNQAEVAGKKISTVLATNMEHERLIQQYETMSTSLLEWIQQSIAMLDERVTIDTVAQCRENLETLNNFRSGQIPPKLEEKATLEEHYSTLQTKLRLSGRPPFVPSEGKEIKDIENAWGNLEASDKNRLAWLLEELRRVQLAESKAALFKTKTTSHNSWIEGREAHLSADDYSSANLAGVSALKKKHEAFQSDLMAHETRVREIGNLANELDELKYSGADSVNDEYAAIYEHWQHLLELTQTRQQNLEAAEEKARNLDELYLQFARQAPPLGNFVILASEKLTEPYVVDTVEDLQALQEAHEAFKSEFAQTQEAFDALTALQDQITALSSESNPYSPHSYTRLAEQWSEVQQQFATRDNEFAQELVKQQEREKIRTDWAAAANEANQWLVARNTEMKDVIGSTSNEQLEDQIAKLREVEAAVAAYSLDSIEALHNSARENLIFSNPHTDVTVESLRGLYAGLKSGISGSINALENQILARDATNISDEDKAEWKKAFNHWDKDGSGFLEHKEFRAFLLSLGTFNINSTPDEGDDAEWDRIVAELDPNGDGKVSFDEFMAFMIKESADAASADELLGAFQTLANGNPYILASDIQREVPAELYEYCIANMTPYPDGPEGALDYVSFANALYGESQL